MPETISKSFSGRCWRGTREHQEDAYIFDPLADDSVVFVVCDGMGGHRRGDLASKAAVTAFAESCHAATDSLTPPEILRTALGRANEAVAKLNTPDPDEEISGCTLVAGFLRAGQLWFISVGDSPLWIHRGGEIFRINKDHSMRTTLSTRVLKRELSQEQFDADKSKNVLLSALTGGEPELIDAPTVPRILGAGDIVLAASDGILTLAPGEIAAICEAHASSMDDLTDSIIAAVREKGKPNQDNTTIAVLICTASAI